VTAGVFVTGTDTGVGKTLVAAALLRAAGAIGLRTAGMKPVAAGTDATGGQEDVAALIAAGNVSVDRQLVNPYCFDPPIAPHIAAAEASTSIDPAAIVRAFGTLAGRTDYLVVEGAGGLLVPLGKGVDTADIAALIGLPLVVVVGLRLGCINHALLTVEAIGRRKLPIAGWIANCVDPQMLRLPQNIVALAERIESPLLATLRWGIFPDEAAIALKPLVNATKSPPSATPEPPR
jgi:dethiobiotin synthetase